MELKTEGIVLKRYDKGEKDNITVIFTKDSGKVFVSSRSTRSPKSKLKAALELFSMNNFMLYRKNDDSGFYTLVQAESLQAFEGIRSSLQMIGAAYYIAEVTDKFIQQEEPNAGLYEILRALLNGMNDLYYDDARGIINYYSLKLLKLTGFNIIDDEEFFKKVDVTEGVRNYVINAEAATKPACAEESAEYGTTVNRMLDSYVSGILNEEVKSMRFVEKLK